MPDQTLKYYDEHAEEISRRYETADLSMLHLFLKREIIERSFVLELGGGSGRDSSFLMECGHDVIFTDGSARMVDQAIRYHPELDFHSVVCRLPDALPFRENSFDVALAVGILMHLEATAILMTIAEIARILKKGGQFIMSIPSIRYDVISGSRDECGRLMNITDMETVMRLNFRRKFRFMTKFMNSDGLNRSGIEWVTLVFDRM